MNKLKFFQIALIVTTLSLTASLLWFIDSAARQYNQVNLNWSKYSQNESKIIDTLLKLNENLGYGGMIHNFKNYVIRGEERYISSFHQNIIEIKESILLLDALHDKNLDRYGIDHDQLLLDVSLVIDEYKKQIINAENMHQSKSGFVDIDTFVKVNDAIALRALSTLRKEIDKRSLKIQKQTSMSFEKSHSFLSNGQFFALPLIILTILLIYYIHKIRRSNEEILDAHELVDTLLDTSPEALICSDTNGRITRVNDQAENLFGYNQEEFLNLKIEQLVPDRNREHHSEYRQNYHKHPRVRPMGEAIDIFAQLKNGELLAVDISLSVAKVGNSQISIAVVRDVSDVRKATQILKHQATHDLLTGLHNRVELEKIFAREIDRAKRYKHQLSVFMVDIDYFKSINDTYGHAFGDIVLSTFAEKLKESMRLTDFSARFGGEEFVVILPETTASNASIQAERLRKSIEEMLIKDKDFETKITISIGVSSFDEDGDNPDDLLSKADEALYKAKENGRNRVELA